MITTTHVLIGAAATTRPHFRPWHITMGFLGGFVPDSSMFLMVVYTRLFGGEGVNLWRKPDGLYWQDPWWTLCSALHSFPIWGVVLAIGWGLYRFSPRWKSLGIGVMIFSGAALLHALFDFPVHTDDAHAQFWPLTDWVFHSPVSYYQPSHYGNIVRPIEMVVDVALAIYMVVRFPQWPVRILSVLLALPPLLMQVLMRFIMH